MLALLCMLANQISVIPQKARMHEMGKRGQNVKVRTHIFLREHERTSSPF
jgi:hypothetical protein